MITNIKAFWKYLYKNMQRLFLIKQDQKQPFSGLTGYKANMPLQITATAEPNTTQCAASERKKC